MSTSPIPTFQQACLASDSQGGSAYLIGGSSSVPGLVEVYYISFTNITAPAVKLVASQVNSIKWFSNAPKACFPSSQTGQPGTLLKLVQFGDDMSFSSVTKSYPSSNDPMLSVGTYTTSTTSISMGHSVIFDKYGQGQIFSVTSNDQATSNNTITLMTLSSPGVVNMNGIQLTPDAISLTMQNTGYILDKAKNGNTTVIYSIIPSVSSTLQQVTAKGGAPVFYPSIAAAALNSQIVIYSAPFGEAPYFNIFDTATQTWKGVNLINNVTSIPTGSDDKGSSNLGAIIGGTVGGIVVIALGIFLFIRNRRTRNRETIANINNHSNNNNTLPPLQSPQPLGYGGMNQFSNANVPQVQYQPQLQPQPQSIHIFQPQTVDPKIYGQQYGLYQPPMISSPEPKPALSPTPIEMHALANSQGSPTVYAASSTSPGLFSLEIQRQQQYSPEQRFSYAVPANGSMSGSPQYVPEHNSRPL
ncbi:hypothetical protein FBU30_009974 [Linnemannia zychae]|nr:hypothetical protein FBU30_009974 [Linnemannia zychae]